MHASEMLCNTLISSKSTLWVEKTTWSFNPSSSTVARRFGPSGSSGSVCIKSDAGILLSDFFAFFKNSDHAQRTSLGRFLLAFLFTQKTTKSSFLSGPIISVLYFIFSESGRGWNNSSGKEWGIKFTLPGKCSFNIEYVICEWQFIKSVDSYIGKLKVGTG